MSDKILEGEDYMITLFGKALSPKVIAGYGYMVWGASLVLSAVSYSIENALFRVFVSALALMLSLLVFGLIILKKGKMDPATRKHALRASYLTLDVVLLLLIVLGYMGSFIQRVLSMNQVLYAVAGFGGILQGALFNYRFSDNALKAD